MNPKPQNLVSTKYMYFRLHLLNYTFNVRVDSQSVHDMYHVTTGMTTLPLITRHNHA